MHTEKQCVNINAGVFEKHCKQHWNKVWKKSLNAFQDMDVDHSQFTLVALKPAIAPIYEYKL
jgi:hypothetical protein